MSAIQTQSIVDNVMYLSLYDRRYQQIAEQEKLATYTIICNEFNIFAQEASKYLASSYTFSLGVTSSKDGYAIIDTTTTSSFAGLWVPNNVTFNFASVNYPLVYRDNGSFMNSITMTTIQSFPQMWTWYAPTQSILIYPIPSVSGIFQILARPSLPEVSVTYSSGVYTFTPSTIDLPTERGFIDYLTYSLAKRVCLQFNTPFGDDKQAELNRLQRLLTNNRQPDMHINAGRAQLTLSRERKALYFPYFYYLSGGK